MFEETRTDISRGGGFLFNSNGAFHIIKSGHNFEWAILSVYIHPNKSKVYIHVYTLTFMVKYQSNVCNVVIISHLTGRKE